MPLKTFPASLARENSIMFELTGTTISGGQTASGVIPLTRMDGGGLWKATLADVALTTADQVRAWRAIAAYCEGGAQPIIVPMCDKRHFPGVPGNFDCPHNDDAPHSDGSDYATNSIEAIAVTAAPLRQAILHIDVTGGTLRGGEHFSINHPVVGWRLYRIIDVEGGVLVQFRPPLREAVAAGTAIEFDHPRCVMRLASTDAMDAKLEQRKWARPTANFIEAFPPFPP
jgi:hypothetical protein